MRWTMIFQMFRESCAVSCFLFLKDELWLLHLVFNAVFLFTVLEGRVVVIVSGFYCCFPVYCS